MDHDCIFCFIVNGDAPVSLVYEDDIASVFMTIGPVNDGHTLVIPKKHVTYLSDLDEDIAMHLFKIAQRTATAIRASSVRCEGINMFLADGEAAFQEVFHLHLHVFPRYQGDDFKLVANWDYQPDRNALNNVAAEIRRAYQRLFDGV